jgi:putative flavoprotein involved in K+ transport
MERDIETVIIGAGQAGLAVSYFLGRFAHEHVVLEQAGRAAHAWLDDRWDSFTLVTPNWSFLIPGAEYTGAQPDGFMNRAEITAHFERYVAQNAFPLELGVQVTAVDPAGSRFRIQTRTGSWRARNVVVAAGMFQAPKIPGFADQLPAGIQQLHSGQYRNPQALPPGAVLVVGSSQSGGQIAEELCQAGRQVYLCTGTTGRAPRRYRGKDIYRWLQLINFLNRTSAQLPSPAARFAGNPQLTGKNGGHSLNLHQFYRDGVRLLGKAAGLEEGHLVLAPDLKENLAKSDQLETRLTHMVDEYIAKTSQDAPPETLPTLRDAYAAPEPASLDFKREGISSIIWAMGYRFDYSWVHFQVFDEFGFPLAPFGATAIPGLYFAGMPWLPGQKTGLLLGVGEVALSVAGKICAAKFTGEPAP